jgi:SNARE protein
MSDLTYWYDEYLREVDQLKEFVEKYKSAITSSNQKLIEIYTKDCEAKSIRVKEVKKSFSLELKLCRDKILRSDFEAKMKEVDDRSIELTKEFSQLRAQNNKSSLFGDTVPAFSMSTEGKTNDTLLTDTHKVQDMTFESLARTRNMIEASKEIGSATVQQLVEQKEQIADIERDIDAMDTNLQRAEKLVSNFVKRMATDRIIQLFAAVNIVVLLGLILYVGGSGKALGASSGGGGHSGGGTGSSFAPSFRPSFAPST